MRTITDKLEIAGIFLQIAALLELKGENSFKIRAYQTAARALERLEGNLADLVSTGAVSGVKGIGKATGQKIAEYLATGKIAYFEELKGSTPEALFELTKIPGLGPKKALILHEQLGVNSIGELEYACRENRLVALPGFGEKSQAKILEGIEFAKTFKGHFLLCDVLPLAEKMAEYLRTLEPIDDALVAGSLRRRKETVGNIDIVASSSQPDAAGEAVAGMPGVGQVTGREKSKISLTLVNGMNVDVRIVLPEQFISALCHFTGSKEHNTLLRGLAGDKGIKINEYGFVYESGCTVCPKSEQELYTALGLSFIEPELREGLGEIEAARKGALPALVSEADIQGVLHIHTTYSDGSAGIADMARAAIKRGFKYIGITDHSQTAVYARGLKPEAIWEQRQEIRRLNSELPEIRILSGIESDILPDGSLDYPDDILAQFDFVIASVHSAFRLPREEMTRRILKAMDNPYVSILGHPTGRILLARGEYAVDLDAVIDAAAKTGTIIEINASPYRLDLDWRWCRKAREKGVLMSINPDAHAPGELDYLPFGVAMARKGWLAAADILNTRTADQALKLLQRKRR